MESFLTKFLRWPPIWQTVFLVGPLVIFIADREVNLLPDFPMANVVYSFIFFSSLVLSLTWPLSIERVLLKKAPEPLRQKIKDQLPKKGAKLFFFIAISVIIISIFLVLPFFEQDLTPEVKAFDETNPQQIKNTFGSFARIAGIIVLIMLVTIALFGVQLLIYAKLSWRSAIILNSIENNRIAIKPESRKEFWLFFGVPLGVWFLNKRILNILNSDNELSDNLNVIDE